LRVKELEVLEQLRRPTSVREFTRLRGRVVVHLEALEEHQLDDEHVDVRTGERIVRSLLALVDHSSELDDEQRSWLRGALNYFVLTSDADNDFDSPRGLHDDALVLNAVCMRLGRRDLCVPEG
jgi:hypothetical protein